MSFKDLPGDIMASKRVCDLTLSKQITTNKETSSSTQKVSLVIQSASNITDETEIQYLQQEIKKQIAKAAKHYDNIP